MLFRKLYAKHYHCCGLPEGGQLLDPRTVRPHVPDRDLRTLSTADLLSLIREDIRDLDVLIRQQRGTGVTEPKRAKHKTVKAALDAAAVPEPDAAEEEAPESPPLHAVSCCNHRMGDFAPWSRVRCPFCAEWHRAGDFPLAT